VVDAVAMDGIVSSGGLSIGPVITDFAVLGDFAEDIKV